MKKTVQIGIILSLVLSLGVMQANAWKIFDLMVGRGNTRVTVLDGAAQILPSGTSAWKNVRVGDSLQAGDEIKTASRSRIELVLPDKSVVRFADNTHFKIRQADAGSDTTPRDVKIHVALGRTWANVTKKVGPKGNFDISTDTAVAGVRGTVYRMNIEADHSALVRVYDGEVGVSGKKKSVSAQQAPVLGEPTAVEGPTEVAGPHEVTMEEWVVIVKSMQEVRISSDGVADQPKDFSEEQDRDEWVNWNKQRDNAS